MSAEQSFSDMVKQAQPVEDVAQPVEDQVVQNETEQQEVAAEGAEATEGQSAPVEQAVQRRDFSDYLKEKGYDIDDVDPDSLYAQAVERIGMVDALEQQLAEMRRQLEASRAPVAQTQPQAQEPPKPVDAQVQAYARKLADLKQPDQTRYQLVEFDQQSRLAKPISSYGADSIAAANEINAYEAEKSRRANILIQNPLSLVEDDVRELIRREAAEIAEQKLKTLQEQQEQARRQAEEERSKESFNQRLTNFYDQNKSKLFILDANGEPRKLFGSQQYSMTVTGQKFHQTYLDLRAKIPTADDLTLMEIALQTASAQNQVPVTPEQKREKFSAQARKQEVRVPSQNTSVAPVAVQATFNRQARFADMVLSDPDNLDNPAVTDLRAK